MNTKAMLENAIEALYNEYDIQTITKHENKNIISRRFRFFTYRTGILKCNNAQKLLSLYIKQPWLININAISVYDEMFEYVKNQYVQEQDYLQAVYSRLLVNLAQNCDDRRMIIANFLGSRLQESEFSSLVELAITVAL